MKKIRNEAFSMQKIIQAAFPSVDAAEYAASYLQQHIPHVAQISVTPRNPNSIAIGSIPQTYFSIYTTAAVSAHNITGRIERQLNEEEILEPERNQTADLRISCSAEAYPTAHSILTALGGSQMQNWDA
jgi:hypothetical protein